MLIEIIGGRHDGLVKHGSELGAFVWIDRHGRCHSQPGDGRELHRVVGKAGPRLRYKHCHNEEVRCENCGWLTPRGDECLLCQERLAA